MTEHTLILQGCLFVFQIDKRLGSPRMRYIPKLDSDPCLCLTIAFAINDPQRNTQVSFSFYNNSEYIEPIELCRLIWSRLVELGWKQEP